MSAEKENTVILQRQRQRQQEEEDDEEIPRMQDTQSGSEENDDDDFEPYYSTDNDPYVYSDDSASLSDAYFFPQPDEAERLLQHRQQQSQHPQQQQQQPLYYYPVAHYYGSLAGGGGRSVIYEHAILDDDDNGDIVMDPPPTASPPAVRWSRERAVAALRGRRQRPHTKKNKYWAAAFLVQLGIIGVLAAWYGWERYHGNSSSEPRSVLPATPTTKPQPVVLQQKESKNNTVHATTTTTTTTSAIVGPLTRSRTLIGSNHNPNNQTFVRKRPSVNRTSTATQQKKSQQEDDESFSVTAEPSSMIETTTSRSSSSFFYLDYTNVIALVSVSCFYAIVLTYLSFGFLLILARALIPLLLVLSIVLALTWGLIGLSLFDPYGMIAATGFLATLLTTAYVTTQWHRVHWASTNLHVALQGIRATADVTLLALTSLIGAAAWALVWTVAAVGVVDSLRGFDPNSTSSLSSVMGGAQDDGMTDSWLEQQQNQQAQEEEKVQQKLNVEKSLDLTLSWSVVGHWIVYVLLLFSFHWTNTVIKNVVRATVASVVGTWWSTPSNSTQHGPGAGSLCTRVGPALSRALTHEFGSVCLASLVVWRWGSCCWWCGCRGYAPSPVPVPRRMRSRGRLVRPRRAHRPSLWRTVQRFCRACNRWSLTYIGLYGYGFVEAGDRARLLFETREWLEIVQDNLIENVLLLASVIIGGSTGTFAVVVEETDGYEFTSFHKPIVTAFVVGSVMGYVLSNILLLGVVGSAVDTVLVCFAAAPFDFEKNHGRLSREMREVWSQHVWDPATMNRPGQHQQQGNLVPRSRNDGP